MRGRAEETGEVHDKSRSQNRRDALDVLALGEKLVSLTPAQLARLPIPEDLLPHIAECKRITAHIAHKRQLAFLAKHMRREEDATLDAIRDALDANSETGRREATQRLPHCSTTTRRPTASSCARWCAMPRPRKRRTSRRAPTARSSRCCAA
ncbi:hypothetical protein G6F50_016366 [Rhizopus delemar]|uniref:DUF615 domain-containing protein n=1 Tax=Rhizopus delemar TaxID=936053 RepID=A0A9P6XTC2_9FUNG|nr:hypothetical protein G6F50_016366 [Rhizopus delemar]